MDMISAGIVGLAFIALIVFCVLAAKTWHWVNIVFVILTFLAGFGAIFGLTKVYHLRKVAVKKYDDAIKNLSRVEKEVDTVIIGDPSSASYDPGTLRYIDGVLSRELTGRGRVWSRGQVTADGDNRVFTFSAARPDAFSPLKDVVLYAFLEQPVGDSLHPAGFIGSVRVVEETAATVKVEPVAIADGQQYSAPTGTWSFFEKMPLDRRGTFKKAIVSFGNSNPEAPQKLKDLAKALDDESAEWNMGDFREILQTVYLQPNRVGLAPDSREYEELIDMYAFDGLTLGTIQNWIDQNSANRVTARFEPKPDEVFVKYEFTGPSKKTGGYQVDSNGTVAVDGLFNRLGHAIDPALQAGGTVTFAKGDTVLVDSRSANGYKRGDLQVDPFSNGEDVKEVDRVYIRQVRDFPYEFVDQTYKAGKLDEEISQVVLNNEVNKTLLADTKIQYDERLRVAGDLEADQGGLAKDFAAISAKAQQKTQQVQQELSTIASLESNIDSAYKQLRDWSITLSRKAFAGR